MMKNPAIPYSDKQLELQIYIDNLERTEEQAKSFSSQFTALQDNLKEFSSILSQFAKDVADDVSDAIKKALNEVKVLESKLENVKQRSATFIPDLDPSTILKTVGITGSPAVLRIGIALIAAIQKGSLSGAALATTAASIITPMAILAIAALTGISLYQIVEATTAYAEVIEISGKITRAKSQLVVLAAEGAKAKALDVAVSLTIDNIAEIIPRIGHITNVWNIVKADAHDLRKFMERLKGDPAKLNEELEAQLALITEAYQILKNALELLANKVVPRTTFGGDGSTVVHPPSSGSGSGSGSGPSGNPLKMPKPPVSGQPGPGGNGGGGDPPDKIPPGHHRAPEVNDFIAKLNRWISRMRYLLRLVFAELLQNPDPVLQAWANHVDNILQRFLVQAGRPGGIINSRNLLGFFALLRNSITNDISALLLPIGIMGDDWPFLPEVGLDFLLQLLRSSGLRIHGPFEYRVPERK